MLSDESAAHSDDASSSSSDNPASWVDDHGDYLYNFACSRLHDSAAAEDAVQETFLAALKGRDTFAGASSLRTWLVGILKHKITDHLRRTAPQLKSDDPEATSAPDTSPFSPTGRWAGHWRRDHSPAHWETDPARACEDREFRDVLDHCLGRLSPRLNAAFTLSIIEQRPTDEVCKVLDITPTNLWVMLTRARQQLRLCMETHWLKGKKRPPRE